MDLGFFSSGDPEKKQIQILKSFANEIEHKFQKRRAYDLDPSFLDRILASLQTLSKITNKHGLQNKISRLEIQITAATRYYLDNKYEEYFERVKAIRDKLFDLEE